MEVEQRGGARTTAGTENTFLREVKVHTVHTYFVDEITKPPDYYSLPTYTERDSQSVQFDIARLPNRLLPVPIREGQVGPLIRISIGDGGV